MCNFALVFFVILQLTKTFQSQNNIQKKTRKSPDACINKCTLDTRGIKIGGNKNMFEFVMKIKKQKTTPLWGIIIIVLKCTFSCRWRQR